MDLGRRSFPTPAGWCFAPRLMLRSIAAECECRCSHSRSALRCVSKHEGAHIGSSSSFETRARPFVLCGLSSACALLRMRTASRFSPAHDVKQPISFSRRVFASGVCDFASLTPNRGVGRAPRDVRVRARHPWGVPSARHKTRVNALMTQHARRLARRLASHNAGRSPLGAPPWRFFTRGRASVSGMTRIRRASSSQPGRSAWRAASRASRGERLRAVAAGRHASLRIQDRL